MKNIVLVYLLLIAADSFAQEFKLKSGDLIFQEACPEDLKNPIKQVTSSLENYRFTHVGIVYMDSRDSLFVLEATSPEVVLTPLVAYLYPEEEKTCYPKSVVGRLKEAYQPLIPEALKIGLALVGKEYDYGYVLGNDKYYCSELIYDILRHANGGKEVFPLNVMTFKSGDTGRIADGWIEHFKKYGLPVPEGELGINPGAMSRCEVIDMMYQFGD